MDYLGTCGWEFPAALVTMEDGKQKEKTPEWFDVRSTAEISDVTAVVLGDRELLRVSFSCTVGRDTHVGEHLVGEVDGELVDLGLIATTDTEISVQEEGSELAINYDYQSTADSNAARSGHASYRVALVGNTPIRLFGEQSVDDVDPAVADLAPQAWHTGLVSMYGYDYDPDNGVWLPGLLVESGKVITPAQLGAYQSSCLLPTTYTEANEEIKHRALQFIGPSKTKLTGTTVHLAKDSQASPGQMDVGFKPTEKQPGLLVDLNGRVPGIGTVQPMEAEMAPEETVVVSPGNTDEMIINARGLRSEEMQGSLGVFLDWDATVLMMGIWNNDEQQEGTVWQYGMLPMPDPAQAQQELCTP